MKSKKPVENYEIQENNQFKTIKTHKTMKTPTNTDLKESNQLHQAMYDCVFDYVWFPVEILCPNKKFKSEEQVDKYFGEHEDYCGVREVEAKYQVNFPIYRLDYMVGLDVVIQHMILDEVEV